jgi:hypothetical protein
MSHQYPELLLSFLLLLINGNVGYVLLSLPSSKIRLEN